MQISIEAVRLVVNTHILREFPDLPTAEADDITAAILADIREASYTLSPSARTKKNSYQLEYMARRRAKQLQAIVAENT